MKTKHSIRNLVTLLLFASFLFTYFLDLTGLILHQWLGIAVSLVAALHLLIHWNWVKAVTVRFFSRTSSQARSYYLLDSLLCTGLAVITLTGLVISSWFNLAVSSYVFWHQIHVAASVVAMAALVLKLALHWKYIAAMLNPARVSRSAARHPVFFSLQSENPKLVSRREALRVIGSVAVVGLVSILKAARALRTVEAAVLPQPALSTQAYQISNSSDPGQTIAASPTAAVQPTEAAQLSQMPTVDQRTIQSSENCVVRCDKGCSYPGRCRRYTDANNNQHCDLGECLAV